MAKLATRAVASSPDAQLEVGRKADGDLDSRRSPSYHSVMKMQSNLLGWWPWRSTSCGGTGFV
jgi:hypothetical protein